MESYMDGDTMMINQANDDAKAHYMEQQAERAEAQLFSELCSAKAASELAYAHSDAYDMIGELVSFIVTHRANEIKARSDYANPKRKAETDNDRIIFVNDLYSKVLELYKDAM